MNNKNVSIAILFFILLSINICGQSGLSRSNAKKQIMKSHEVYILTVNVPIQKFALQKGAEQGFWTIDAKSGGRSSIHNYVGNKKASKSILGVNNEIIILREKASVDIEITGISSVPMSDNFKEAQFTWKYIKLPQLVKRFALAGGSGSAIFRLFDDGWRLQEVKTIVSNSPVKLSQSERDDELADIKVADEIREREENEKQLVQAKLDKHIQESKTPTKTIRTISFPYSKFSNSKFNSQEIILTDVNIQFLDTYGSIRDIVWFSDISYMESAKNPDFIDITTSNNNGEVEYFYIPCIEKYNSNFMEIFKKTVASWRSNYYDLVSKYNPAKINREAVISDLNNIATMAQQYYKKPVSMGAGGNSFIGWAIPRQLVTSLNGNYEITKLESQSLLIKGTGKEIGNNGTDNVFVKIIVTPTSAVISVGN